MENQLQNALSAHRPALVRWFTRLSGDPQAAEDLTQETLVEAWTHRDRLTDPTGATRWINAIGANVYKRWCRRRGIEARLLADLDDETPSADAEIDLDRDELVGLLDAAMALLLPESRALLTARYLENVPPSELARRLGLTELAAAVRLHRGRLLLRRLVEGDGQAVGRGPTRLWCLTCGQAHYDGRFDSVTGEFVICCPRCTLPPRLTAWEHQEVSPTPLIRGLKSIKPAFRRLMQVNEQHFRPALSGERLDCLACGREVTLQRQMPAHMADLLPDHPGVHYVCPHCGHLNSSALSGIGISTAQGIAFWQAHPRLHQLPIRRVEHEGRELLVLSWESLSGSRDELAVIFARDSYEILSILRSDDRD